MISSAKTFVHKSPRGSPTHPSGNNPLYSYREAGMVHMALTWALHMLTSDQMRIHVERASKFLGFIAEDLT